MKSNRTTWTLTWRLLRGGGRHGNLGVALSVAASALCTTLLFLCVAANSGFGARAAHTDWRTPAKSDLSHAVAIQAVATTFVNGEPVTVVDVAALPGRRTSPPAPPGMPRFPEPGEVWTSPALAELPGVRRLLGLPGLSGSSSEPPTGTLGRAALARPGELVAVVGHEANSPTMTTKRGTDPRRPGDMVTPTLITNFKGARTSDGITTQYQDLTKLATALVIIPLLLLGASSARLSVSRRDSRLALLRLLGAAPSRIAGMAAAEAALTAAAGAVTGALGYAALLPLAANVPVAGGSWYVSDLWVGTPVLLAVLTGVVLMVTVSALAGLRQVVVGPLGVVRRSRTPRLKAVRALLFVAVLLGYWQLSKGRPLDINTVVYCCAAVFAALSVIGPWVVGTLGSLVTDLARRPTTLLAGRRLLDDPKSVWRAVSGLTLAGFVAGFFALFGIAAGSPWDTPGQLSLAVPKERVAAVRELAEVRLRDAGIGATVGITTTWVATGTGTGDERQFTATVNPSRLDAARAALSGLTPGQYPLTGTDIDWQSREFDHDFHLATLTVLAASFTIAIASTGITAASSVLDRRRTYGLLHLAGTPLRVLDTARRTESVLPGAILTTGAVLTGLFCAAPLTFAGGTPHLDAHGLALLTGCLALGFAGLAGASAASRPLLREVVRGAGPRPD
ncbi:FtsX-like permease family protein [Streptomyces sp. NPDC051554]|uniref:FtsX-like permease family protein n=1 Tax=Streptomyces sp. NPDC051554 TaxID=3365656 RepID=UPI00379D6DD6